MKKFKVFGLMLIIVTLASMSVLAGGKSEKQDSTKATGTAKELTEGKAVGKLPKNFTIGKIPITLANGYHQADVAWFTKYAEEQYGAKVKVLDGKFEQATIVANLDQLVAEGVDAIVLHTYEAESVEAGIRAARKAGIPIITFYLQTNNDIPFVAINEADQAFEMGVATAKAWTKFHPDKPIIYGVVDYVDSPVVQAMRTGPFIKGLKSVAPNAKEGLILDGGGTRDTGYKAAQDMIQSHPEINVFYGASSDYSLAILPALEEAGRGKAVKGVPNTEILVGTDATEAELVKVFDPNSSFKVTMGLTPRENGILKVDTIVKAYLGEIDPDKRQTIEAHDKEIDYWSANIDEIQKWLEDEYMTKANLKK
ncbi:MAG: sugar ABC transporter substrate-binding protein [Spirochaetales bacterium]|nr:MAG: sugar ABC transporter substrate-binding protein [Spirochaetales bacterium]